MVSSILVIQKDVTVNSYTYFGFCELIYRNKELNIFTMACSVYCRGEPGGMGPLEVWATAV